MPPFKQNTFTLVPNKMGMQGLLSREAAGEPIRESKPPMTSKQAKKLYLEATRQPRVSREEARRIEREEQERIRNEFEKEKAANKARILREKKKAKEDKAKEEKRKKGLPLFQVHPSQDTITRFVRGNGVSKKRSAPEAEIPRPQDNTTNSDKENEPLAVANMDEELPNKRRQRASQDDNEPLLPKKRQRISQFSQENDKNEPVAPEIEVRLPELPAPRPVSPSSKAPRFLASAPVFRSSPRLAASTGKVQAPRFIPSRFQTPATPKAPSPLGKVQARSSSVALVTSAPPSNTQMFLMSHIDEFPTPSQTLRELQECGPVRPPVPAFGTKPVPAIETSGQQRKPGKIVTATLPRLAEMREIEKDVLPFFSTQDLILSSQDLRELEGTTETPCKAKANVGNGGKPFASECGIRKSQPRVFRRNRLEISSGAKESRINAPAQKRNGASQVLAASPCLPLAAQQEQPVSTPVAASPAKSSPAKSPQRFFGPSGVGIQILMAMLESEKTHAAEEEKRKQERLEQERLEKEVLEKQQQDDKNKKSSTTELPVQHSKWAASGSNAKRPQLGSSQETDYGDFEFDDVDFDALDTIVVANKPGPLSSISEEDLEALLADDDDDF
ncbi:hypothetical protein B0H63DRAFT_255249 [Podospora didyma]|uniref:Uncharacterized protein n=1 Tax=Podospora didyma TaxID=330526 RepID=A0AAE0KEE8_9PEZI|nr:hypothetical protein B0H63DRAFT_255249 [Podospora didyma]